MLQIGKENFSIYRTSSSCRPRFIHTGTLTLPKYIYSYLYWNRGNNRILWNQYNSGKVKKKWSHVRGGLDGDIKVYDIRNNNNWSRFSRTSAGRASERKLEFFFDYKPFRCLLILWFKSRRNELLLWQERTHQSTNSNYKRLCAIVASPCEINITKTFLLLFISLSNGRE